MVDISKIFVFVLIANIKIFGGVKYIAEQDLKESSIENNKILLYPLEINEKSYIRSQDNKKRYIMVDNNRAFCVFKYNGKDYILATNICPCCFTNCYAILIKDDYEDCRLSYKLEGLREELKRNNIDSIIFNGKDFLICNEYLKFKNWRCCVSCRPKLFSSYANESIKNKGNEKEFLKMIFVTDTNFEEKAVTLDLCENVKIVDLYAELTIIDRKTVNEVMKSFKNKY